MSSMKMVLMAMLVLFTFAACDSEKNTFKKNIEQLESALSQSPTSENTLQLLNSYEQYAKEFPNDAEWSGRYLYRAAGLQYRARDYKRSLDYLKQVLNDYSASSAKANALLLIGNIYEEKLLNEAEARKAYQQFLDEYPNHPEKETAAFFFKPLKDKLAKRITDLEASLYQDEAKTQINTQVAAMLRRVYAQYGDLVVDDPENGAEYLLRSVDLLLATNNFAGAEKILVDNLQKYGTTKAAPSMLLQLANINENYMLNEEQAKAYAQQFLAAYPDHPEKETASFYLKPLSEKVNLQIEQLEAKVYGDTTNYRIDMSLANRLINKYQQFAELNPTSAQTPANLYKAAEISRSTRNFPQAIDLWKKIYDDYPTYEKAGQALFLQGYVYENDLRNPEAAKSYYEEFIQKYPDHEMIESVKFSLANLGKSPDEIMKMFEEKNKSGE
ncbi:MAG: tetratricopeptide repeat protein [Bacteroidota bacterium]